MDLTEKQAVTTVVAPLKQPESKVADALIQHMQRFEQKYIHHFLTAEEFNNEFLKTYAVKGNEIMLLVDNLYFMQTKQFDDPKLKTTFFSFYQLHKNKCKKQAMSMFHFKDCFLDGIQKLDKQANNKSKLSTLHPCLVCADKTVIISPTPFQHDVTRLICMFCIPSL
jgi:hypothetical protein